MNKKRLYLKNFGPIKELEMDIKPLTVLIGDSGSGKSAILKITSLLHWIHKQNNLRTFFYKSKLAKKGEYSRLKGNYLLKTSGLLEFVNKDTEIIFETNGVTYTSKGKLPTDATISKLSLEKVAFISENRGVLPDIYSNKIPRGLNLPYYLNDTYNLFIDAFDILNNKFDLESTQLQLFQRSNKLFNKIFIKDKNNNYELQLENASSGTKTALFIEVIIRYLTQHFNFGNILNGSFQNFLRDKMSTWGLRKQLNTMNDFPNFEQMNLSIFIEEPELSLYPSAQIRLINRMIKDCFIDKRQGINTQLSFATHSPYIINYLNLLIKANKENNTTHTKGLKLSADDLEIYYIGDGIANSLKATNIDFIDTSPLSEDIESIYNSYVELNSK